MKVLLFNALKKIAIAAISERVLKKVIISLLKEGAKRTDWEIDDEIVAEIEKALD